MDIQSFLKSKYFLVATWAIAGLVILTGTFKLGVIVGYHKANFANRWTENYHRNFENPKMLGRIPLGDNRFISPHGNAGKIIKITPPSELIIAAEDGIETSIMINGDTIIREFRNNIDLERLNVDDFIMFLGEPNEQGQIRAKFIRLLPENLPFPPIES